MENEQRNLQWPEQRDKLWVTGFSTNISAADLCEFCERFGKFVHMHRTKQKNSVFLKYMTEEDAALALTKFRYDNIIARYATDKRGTPVDNLNGASNSKQTNENGSRHVRFSNGNASHDSGPLDQEKSQQKAIFRSGKEVIITHVRKDFHFYAYPKAIDHDHKQLLTDISKSAKNAECLKKVPQKSDLVLAPCNGDYCRALVINNTTSESDLVYVSLIDFGSTAEVPYHELKMLSEKFLHTRHTYRFNMDSTEFANNAYAAECFKSFVGSILRMECDQPFIKPLSSVRLIEPNTNECINTLIKQMTLTFTIDEMKKNPAPIGTNKELTVIDNTKLKDGLSFITFVDQSTKLECYRQRNQIQTIATILQKCPPYLPNKDELCFVHFNANWYRGSFDETFSETTASVLLVDIYKGVQVELKNIRKITQDFAQEPILTFTAALHGYSSKISKEEADGLMQKFKINDDIHATSVSESDDEVLQTLGIYSVKI